jgi:hypothetical protein
MNRIMARLAAFAGLILLISAACALPASPAVTPTALSITATMPPVANPPIPANPTPTTSNPPAAQPTNTLPPPAANPSPTKAPPQVSQVTIYFVAVGDNGQSGPKVGCGDSLVAVKQPIEPTSGVIRAALTRLFSFKQQDIGQSGLYNALWQSDLRMESGRVDAGVATINLTGTVKMGGECDTPRFKSQIEQTILAQPGVKSAVIFLNGKPIDQALSLK